MIMYTETDLVGIAKRDNNPKRNYLVVNRLQGKHIPVPPHSAFEMFDMLAGRLKEAYGQEKLLLVGFAETATAIGARLAVQLDTYYIQTTREQMPGVKYLLFSESHSHATEQKLVKDDMDAMFHQVDRIVFVEDELTTGNTILNIIDLLQKEYPGKMRFAAASILNGMDETATGRYGKRQIGLVYLQKTDHSKYVCMAKAYAGDGLYIPADTDPCRDIGDLSRVYRLPASYVNARRCIAGKAYQRACEAMWEQACAKCAPVSGKTVLILGTEEFMYPALFAGERLQRMGYTVKCHATTRSPITVSRECGYPLHVRYELVSLYEEGRRTFIYDLERYDSVWIFTDAANPVEGGICSLWNALRLCGNDDIRLFCWGDFRTGGNNEKLL